jgi:hypothetical protein
MYQTLMVLAAIHQMDQFLVEYKGQMVQPYHYLLLEEEVLEEEVLEEEVLEEVNG